MYRLTELLLLILQSVSDGQHEILVRVTLAYPRETPQQQQHVRLLRHCFSMHIWTEVWPYVRSVEQLFSTVAGETTWRNYTGDEESVDANASNVTASTSKNTRDNNMDIKDSVQPQLSEVITASTACFIVAD